MTDERFLQTVVMHSRSGAEYGKHNNIHLLTYLQYLRAISTNV